MIFSYLYPRDDLTARAPRNASNLYKYLAWTRFFTEFESGCRALLTALPQKGELVDPNPFCPEEYELAQELDSIAHSGPLIRSLDYRLISAGVTLSPVLSKGLGSLENTFVGWEFIESRVLWGALAVAGFTKIQSCLVVWVGGLRRVLLA